MKPAQTALLITMALDVLEPIWNPNIMRRQHNQKRMRTQNYHPPIHPAAVIHQSMSLFLQWRTGQDVLVVDTHQDYHISCQKEPLRTQNYQNGEPVMSPSKPVFTSLTSGKWFSEPLVGRKSFASLQCVFDKAKETSSSSWRFNMFVLSYTCLVSPCDILVVSSCFIKSFFYHYSITNDMN